MKLYIEDIFIENFPYYADYGFAYSLENSEMGFVLTPFLDKNLLNIEIKEEKCIISIPQDIPLVKVEHISDFCYEAQIPYDSSFTYLTYYHMFSLLYKSEYFYSLRATKIANSKMTKKVMVTQFFAFFRK